GIVAGIFLAVRNQKLCEPLDIELMFRDHAAVRGPGHGWKHGGETSITSENFEDQEAFVGAGAGTQAVGHGNGASDAGAEADAVVGTGNIIVHGLGNGDDLHAFLIKANAVAQRVIAANRDQVVDSQPIEILQNLWSQIVLLGVVGGLQMNRNARLLYLARIGARAMKERAAGAAGTVD